MRATTIPPSTPERSEPPAAVTLDLDDRDRLLGLVRASLAVATGAAPPDALDGPLQATADLVWPAAAFVTLTEGRELRGCIGAVDPDRPLRDAIVGAAFSAALHDPRMRPVSAAELGRIHVEISVLGIQVPLADPAAFRPGLDGVIVERDGRLAILLPEVATTCGWGTAEMLEAVCQKAGLHRDAWRDPETRLTRFRTTRFGGSAVA